MIERLARREKALEPLGRTRRQAEWPAPARLDGGAFVHARWARFMNAHREQGRRIRYPTAGERELPP